jgi:hypothetical protein
MITCGDDTLPGHVIHLPVAVADLGTAVELAARLAELLAGPVPELDRGEITVSPEDAQYEHHRVFCDRLLDSGGRCARRARHVGGCLPATRTGPTPGPIPAVVRAG